MSLFKKIMAPEVLNEAQDYKAIFNDIFRLWEMFLHTDAGDPFKGDYTNEGQTYAQFIKTWMMERVEEEVTWARTNLKKNDRIVWYLRYAKLGLLSQLTRGYSHLPGEAIEAARDFILARILPPFITKMNEYTKTTRGTPLFGDETNMITSFGSGRILDMQSWLTHYLSLPIAGIQNKVFGFEHFMNLKEDFRKLEHEWAESRKGRIDYDETTVKSIVLNFGDGFVWADLGRGACSEEADAMGHCGNVPSKQDGDTILSLRQIAQEGNKKYWRPCLTFILHKDGFLGEMKGRANEKPAERYHKYILPLLKLDIIKGIRGGGYAPERNFTIGDLTEDEQWELFNKKPEFGEIAFATLIMKRGSDEQKQNLTQKIGEAVVEVVMDEVSLKRPPEGAKDMDGRMVLGQTDLESFISLIPKSGSRTETKDTLKSHLEFMEDNHAWRFWPDHSISKSEWEDWLVEKPEIVEFFKAYCEREYPDEFSEYTEENEANDLENLCSFLDEQKNPDFANFMKSCSEEASRAGHYRDILKDLRKYFMGVEFKLYVGNLTVDAIAWPDEYDKKNSEDFYPESATMWICLDLKVDTLQGILEKEPDIVEQILHLKEFGSRYSDVTFDEFPGYHASDWYTNDDKAGQDYFEENYEEAMGS